MKTRGLRSMTGYAQAHALENGWSLRVSLRSVNHRFLDLHLRVPEGFEPIEPAMCRIVREYLRRGHVDLTVQYEMAGPAAVGVNQEVAAAYMRSVKELREKFAMHNEPDIAAILRLPGVIGAPTASTPGPGRIAGELPVEGPSPRPQGFRTTEGFRHTAEQASERLRAGMEGRG